MAEKIIPDVEFFAQEIVKELQADLPMQRNKIAQQLINLSPEKISELHLQDWYGVYWKLMDALQYVKESPQNREKVAQQILEFAKRESNPTRRQFFALALLLFGKVKEFNALADKNLWTPNLREDFDTFSKFNKLTSLSSNLHIRANVRRNQQIKNFIQNKYSYLIQKYSQIDSVDKKTSPRVKDFKIWYCWLQGEDNLPPVAQCCYNSLKMNAGKYKVCFIDENNYTDYVTLPEHIVKKFMGGGITRTHFSDILRINLLEQYGGLWLDATNLVTDPLENYKHFWKLPYFTQKFYHAKILTSQYAANFSCGRWMVGIQGSSVLHNPLFGFIRDFFNEYTKDFDEFLDYFLLDLMMDIAYDNIPVVKINFDKVPINNTKIWQITNLLNVPYAQYPYDKIIGNTFFVRLSYKTPLDFNTPNTIFREIQKRYAPETIGKF